MKFNIFFTWLIVCCLVVDFASNGSELSFSDQRSVSKYSGDLQKFMGATIWHIGKKWRYAMEKALKPLNITFPQFVLLTTLAHITKDGKKVTQMEVSRLADLDAKGSSQVFIALEEKKYIKRKHTGDGKCIHPSTTPLGKKIIEQGIELIEKAEIDFFAEFTKKQINATKKLHQLLHEVN